MAPSPFLASALSDAILPAGVQAERITPSPGPEKKDVSSQWHRVFPFLSGKGLTIRGMSQASFCFPLQEEQKGPSRLEFHLS